MRVPFEKQARDAAEAVKERTTEYREFSTGLYGNFRRNVAGIADYMRSEKNTARQVEFHEAQRAWGFPAGEQGVRMGRKSMLLLTVIFYAVAAWCIFYSVQSVLNYSFLPLVSSILGVTAGAIAGTVSLWRFVVFMRREYVPFGKWLWGARILGMLLIFAFALSLPEAAYAAASTPPIDINIPTQFTVQKTDDITSGMFFHLLGDSWNFVSGGTGAPFTQEGMGVYANLIVSILHILNVVCMVYVGAAVIYMWGMFSVITAHEGQKFGGSIYNSLWVPIRHATALCISVPVLNGLSLLQVGMLGLIGVSINMANVIWDTAGSYIVERGRTALITSAPSYVTQEGYRLVYPMFRASVAQEIVKNRKDGKIPTSAYPNDSDAYHWNETPPTEIQKMQHPVTTKFVAGKWTSPNKTEYGKTGTDYVESINYLSGTLRLNASTVKGMTQGSFGGIEIPYPKGQIKKIAMKGRSGFKLEAEDSDAVRDAKIQIALAREKAAIELWDGVRVWACNYLADTRILNSNTPCGENPDIPALVDAYAASVIDATKTYGEAIVKSDAALTAAITRAIDHNGKESTYGWASAGLFSFSLASVQKKIDDVLTSGSSTFKNAETASPNYEAGFFRKTALINYTPDEKRALLDLQSFVMDKMLKNKYFMSPDRDDTGQDGFDPSKSLGDLAEKVASMFAGNEQGVADGILATTLYQFERYDPLVVMSWFGERLMQAGKWAFTAGVPAAVFGFSALMLCGVVLFALGIVFSYIAPITPVIFWLRALLTWIYLVVESMVAAPFWAATHCLPEGQGFTGQHTRRGYMMMLDIAVRPILLTIGAVVAIAVMQATGWLYAKLLNSWLITAGSFIQMDIVAEIVFSCILISIFYYASITIFTKGVNHMPQRVTSWIGGSGGATLGEENAGSESTAKVYGAVVSSGNQTGAAIATGSKAAYRGGKKLGQLFKKSAGGTDVAEKKDDGGGTA